MILHLIVKPNSKKDELKVSEDDTIRVKIKVSPVNGKANEYLVKFLSSELNISKSNIELIAGFKSAHKKILVQCDEAYLQQALKRYK